MGLLSLIGCVCVCVVGNGVGGHVCRLMSTDGCVCAYLYVWIWVMVLVVMCASYVCVSWV